MKRDFYVTVVLVGTLLAAGAVISFGAHSASADKNSFTPDAIPYGPGPAFVPAGAQLAETTQVRRPSLEAKVF